METPHAHPFSDVHSSSTQSPNSHPSFPSSYSPATLSCLQHSAFNQPAPSSSSPFPPTSSPDFSSYHHPSQYSSFIGEYRTESTTQARSNNQQSNPAIGRPPSWEREVPSSQPPPEHQHSQFVGGSLSSSMFDYSLHQVLNSRRNHSEDQEGQRGVKSQQFYTATSPFTNLGGTTPSYARTNSYPSYDPRPLLDSNNSSSSIPSRYTHNRNELPPLSTLSLLPDSNSPQLRQEGHGHQHRSSSGLSISPSSSWGRSSTAFQQTTYRSPLLAPVPKPPSPHFYSPEAYSSPETYSDFEPQQTKREIPSPPIVAPSKSSPPLPRKQVRTPPSPARSSTSGGTFGNTNPISPITGRPTKTISKRLYPPRDADKRKYKCEAYGCGRAFGRPSALTAHTRHHTGVRPFECPVTTCGRPFSVFSNLKRHMLIHPGVDFKRVTVHDLPFIAYDSRRDPPLFWIDRDDVIMHTTQLDGHGPAVRRRLSDGSFEGEFGSPQEEMEEGEGEYYEYEEPEGGEYSYA